ncbi:MAG: diphosphomevalonate decarboxylase [Anaerolineae bacterium]|nr:diphosphomevalonate decarboxylase [Anaerolineae bacterium]
MMHATAYANSNIAFIKYWGNRDETLRLPSNSSLSMNLNGVFTRTTVHWDDTLKQDHLILNGQDQTGEPLMRVSQHLDAIRKRLNLTSYAQVDSENNFPMGAGIASSASSFAALTVAGFTAAGASEVSEREMTTIARLGSGSASRSIPTGFVEWHAADRHEDSYAESIATPDHWDLVDVIAIVSSAHKEVGSKQGHPSANTSDLQSARVAGADDRLQICKTAILDHDFDTFAEVVERDSNLMHAVMMTSRPALFYWQPASLTVMSAVRRWRADGLQVCYTLDAGPNVHCLCTARDAETIQRELSTLDGVKDVRFAAVGAGARS